LVDRRERERTERFSRSPPALGLLGLPPGGHDRAGTTDDR